MPNPYDNAEGPPKIDTSEHSAYRKWWDSVAINPNAPVTYKDLARPWNAFGHELLSRMIQTDTADEIAGIVASMLEPNCGN